MEIGYITVPAPATNRNKLSNLLARFRGEHETEVAQIEREKSEKLAELRRLESVGNSFLAKKDELDSLQKTQADLRKILADEGLDDDAIADGAYNYILTAFPHSPSPEIIQQAVFARTCRELAPAFDRAFKRHYDAKFTDFKAFETQQAKDLKKMGLL